MRVEWKVGTQGTYEVLDVREGGMARVYIVPDRVLPIKLAAKYAKSLTDSTAPE